MSVRAMFWEDDDARAVAARLRSAGFDAALSRDRFAGEDDDEDQPWLVVSDAPAVMVELLLEEYDGWLDDAPSGDPTPPAPLDLPRAPRRFKRDLG